MQGNLIICKVYEFWNIYNNYIQRERGRLLLVFFGKKKLIKIEAAFFQYQFSCFFPTSFASPCYNNNFNDTYNIQVTIILYLTFLAYIASILDQMKRETFQKTSLEMFGYFFTTWFWWCYVFIMW
eukprot:TRINITY_DN625_c0_g3_i1.p6 TRINITY_DN625_c0_g3~~TRINITY_DN625_c0_g3_i1.p6  ORF type:complete len:125 (-),score=3.05 TRINITY_DN625_c0_g3_i1:297-671(-)